MTHLTRTKDLKPDSAILIDAKQRGIFTRNARMCAEPSPDALSALAASNKLDLATPQGTSIGEALSISEAAGSIGLRTQSIQLMRDHMYRLCEAFQNGAITPFTFELLHRRFQTTMVAILAIEQLTGVARPPAVVLGGSSTAGDADAVVKLTATREDAAKAVTSAQAGYDAAVAKEDAAKTDVDSAQKALDAANGDAVAAAQAKLDSAKKVLADATAAKLDADGVLAGRKAALAAVDRALNFAASTASTTSVGSIGADTHTDPVSAVAIANAVQAIVTNAMGLGNRSDFCFVLMGDAAQRNSIIDPNSAVLASCLKLLHDDAIKLNDHPVLPM